MKVLVTGAGALLGQGIIRSLQMSSLSPEIIAVDPSPLAAGLYWTKSRYLVPFAVSQDYGDAIGRILESEQPDAILVGTDVELEFFAAHREGLEERYRTHVVVSCPEAVAIADDKYLTYQFLHEHGFHPPESRLASEADELVERFGFPLVVKPRMGARSVGVRVIRNHDELSRALSDGDDVVVQEFLSDEDGEYTAGTLTFNDTCSASIVMRRDLRDGNTYRAFTVQDGAVDRQVRAMAESLGAYGPANFQFRLSEGRVRVFEINCRFSGTTPLRAMAGFNEVDMVLRYLRSGDPIEQPRVSDLAILRHWSETVLPRQDLVW
jgi:carbamoyl-phosphate synthase large subunit